MIRWPVALWPVALGSLACGDPPDPDLVAKREAIAAFGRARAKLEAGDAEGARAAFAALPEVHPVVEAWEARAAAATGDLDAAIAVLDEAVADYPGLGILRYNHAAYLARRGRIEAAAAELEVAVDLGEATVREALADPDFAPHLAHPAFAGLVANALVVAVEPPPTSTFLGSEVRLTLRITGAEGLPLTVEGPEARGPVRLIEQIDAQTDPAAGPGRTLTWAWRVEGPGSIVLDPLVVTAGPLTARSAGPTIEAVAPPGRGDPESRPITFPVASQIGADLDAGAARWVDGRLQVKLAGRERLDRRPPGTPPRRYTFRKGGVTLWVVEEHVDDPPLAALSVVRGAEEPEPVAIPPRPGPSTGD